MKSCARIAAPDPSTMGFQFMSDSLYSQLLVGNLFHGNEASANNAFKHRDLLEGDEALFHEDIKPAIVNANDASTGPNNGLKNSLSGTNNGLNYISVPNLQIKVGGGQASFLLPSSNCLEIKPPINNPATVSMKRSRKSSHIEAVNAASKRQKSTPFLRKRASEGDIVEQPLAGRKPSGKIKTPKPGAEPPKTDYVHVRARRGQATDSHSLAERVRREKISERMRFLQDLVPGCSKITGKALILDEIINYVQSLQHQVEFLAMRLAAISPKLDHLNVNTFTNEEIASPFVKVNEACTKLVPNFLATQSANFEMQLESLPTICIGSFDEL